MTFQKFKYYSCFSRTTTLCMLFVIRSILKTLVQNTKIPVIKYRAVLKGKCVHLNLVRLFYETIKDGRYGTLVKYDSVFNLLERHCSGERGCFANI